MAFTITHTKVSAIPDNAAASAAGEVLPSDWNANHTIVGTADTTIDTSPIIGGTTGRVLYDNNGTIGEASNVTIDSGGYINTDVIKSSFQFYLYPENNNTTNFTNIVPHGSPVDSGYGFAVLDIGNADYLAVPSVPTNTIHMQIGAAGAFIGSNIYSAASAIPLLFGQFNGDTATETDSFRINTNATVDFLQNINVIATKVYQYNNVNALFQLTGGASGDSWFFGGAGNFNANDSQIGMGSSALASATAGGGRNVAIGHLCSNNSTTGTSNVAIGYQAMATNIDGSRNMCFGESALFGQTHNGSCVAIGYHAAYNTTGNNQVAIGDQALVAATIGAFNGGYNIGIGTLALQAVSTGISNTGIGDQVGPTVTTGSQCIIIGAGCDVSSAGNNGQLSIGNYIYGTGLTGQGSTISTGKIGIGTKGPATELDVNGTISVQSLPGLFVVPNGSGDNWFFAGAGNLTTTGNQNVGIGDAALLDVTSGIHNMAIGTTALSDNLSGVHNVAIGTGALQAVTTHDKNVAIGTQALNAQDAHFATAIGYQSLVVASGEGNTAIGYQAGAVVSSGNYNVIIGTLAAPSLTTGTNNIVLGIDVDVPNAAGSYQLSIGNFIYGTGLSGHTSSISPGWIGIGKTSAFGSEALGVVGGITVSGDPGGSASSNTLSGTSSTTISTGVGVIHMSTANPATNTGWLKCYIGTQVAWIPCWTTNAP